MTDAADSGVTDSQPAAEPRCPACGQLLSDQSVDECPFCSFAVADLCATDDDVTPYALAFEKDQGGLFCMCKWVWMAGAERLKHLAMMRSSPASRRFAGIHVVVLALALGVLRATWLGWRVVSHAQASTGSIAKPIGRGWFRVVSLTPVPGDERASAIAGIWWNPAQALLGGAIALVAAFVLIAVVRSLIRAGLEAAHAGQYRGEQRMTAAQCYATAWLVPLIIATIILWMRPFALFAGASATSSGDLILMLPAGIIAGIGVVFGWFWVVRLAATAPVDIRSRVTIMLAFGAPAITLAGAVVWWVGLEKLYEPLFDALQMSY